MFYEFVKYYILKNYASFATHILSPSLWEGRGGPLIFVSKLHSFSLPLGGSGEGRCLVLFRTLQQRLQSIQIFSKSAFAEFGGTVSGEWFFAHKFFANKYIIFFFQDRNMTCQIAIGERKQFFDGTKFYGVIDHEHGHDAEPNPIVEGFVI